MIFYVIIDCSIQVVSESYSIVWRAFILLNLNSFSIIQTVTKNTLTKRQTLLKFNKKLLKFNKKSNKYLIKHQNN